LDIVVCVYKYPSFRTFN